MTAPRKPTITADDVRDAFDAVLTLAGRRNIDIEAWYLLKPDPNTGKGWRIWTGIGAALHLGDTRRDAVRTLAGMHFGFELSLRPANAWPA